MQNKHSLIYNCHVNLGFRKVSELTELATEGLYLSTEYQRQQQLNTYYQCLSNIPLPHLSESIAYSSCLYSLHSLCCCRAVKASSPQEAILRSCWRPADPAVYEYLSCPNWKVKRQPGIMLPTTHPGMLLTRLLMSG